VGAGGSGDNRFMNILKRTRGLALIAIALFFGLQADGYPIGSFANAGPGLFPLLVSGLVGVIGLVMVGQSFFEAREALQFNARNIAVVLVSLTGFVLISQWINMSLAVVFLVFFSTLAGTDYSIRRNTLIAAVLLGIAWTFRSFLGLNLPLL
jgi:hypothetical protein